MQDSLHLRAEPTTRFPPVCVCHQVRMDGGWMDGGMEGVRRRTREERSSCDSCQSVSLAAAYSWSEGFGPATPTAPPSRWSPLAQILAQQSAVKAAGTALHLVTALQTPGHAGDSAYLIKYTRSASVKVLCLTHLQAFVRVRVRS